MTKRFFVLTLAVALVAGSGGFVFAADDFSGQGEVVEMGCYKRQNATGEGHAGCAKRCFGDGAGMGLLQSDGKVIELSFDDEKTGYDTLVELAGKQAKVSGTMADGKVTVKTAAAAG